MLTTVEPSLAAVRSPVNVANTPRQFGPTLILTPTLILAERWSGEQKW